MTITVSMDDVGKTASFTLYPSAIIRDDFTNVKILAVVGYETAEVDSVSARHQEVYPTLPANTPNDYRAYLYLAVKMQDGTVRYIGLPWIVDGSWQVSSTITLTVEIHGKTTSDVDALKNVLIGNGFTEFAIKVSSV